MVAISPCVPAVAECENTISDLKPFGYQDSANNSFALDGLY